MGVVGSDRLRAEPSLLDGLKQKDREAQRRFYETQRPIVLAACASILRDPAEAAEVADGVLTDFLFDVVDRLEREGAMSGYLKLMAVRRSFRRKERVRAQDEVGDDLGSADAPADMEQSVEARVLLPRLRRCLEGLTPKAREALRLRYGGELTNEHIGELVGGSKQYIGRLLTRSLEVLKSCIEQLRPGEQRS